MNLRSFFAGLAVVAALSAFGAASADAQGFSVAFGNRDFVVQPGGTFGGSIEVSSNSEKPVTLRVFIGEVVRTQGNVTDYNLSDETGKEPRSLVPWIRFSPDQLTIQPGEKQLVTFEGALPADVPLDGSYWCAIFIEGVPSEEDVAKMVEEDDGEKKMPRIGIKTVFRFATKIYATIQGTEKLDCKFSALALDKAAGGFDARAVFENMGNVFVRPKVWLEMRDVAGEVAYTLEHNEITVLPESAREFKFEVRGADIPAGEYLLMVIADYGGPKLVAAQAKVDITEAEENGEGAQPGGESAESPEADG